MGQGEPTPQGLTVLRQAYNLEPAGSHFFQHRSTSLITPWPDRGGRQLDGTKPRNASTASLAAIPGDRGLGREHRCTGIQSR